MRGQPDVGHIGPQGTERQPDPAHALVHALKSGSPTSHRAMTPLHELDAGFLQEQATENHVVLEHLLFEHFAFAGTPQSHLNAKASYPEALTDSPPRIAPGRYGGSEHERRTHVGENATLGIIAIVAAILLILAVIVILLVVKEKRRVESLSPADRAVHDALQAAKSEYGEAIREHKGRVRAAEKDYRREMGAVDAKMRSAQAQMTKAEKTGRSLVQSYRGKDGNIALFEHEIVINGKIFPLDNTVSATVDSSGNLARTKRSTLTRMTAGGVLLGPVGILAGGMIQKKKLHDDRELYLLVEGREFTALLTCQPEQGVTVRQFAAKISQASKTVSAADARHEEALEQANMVLRQVTADANASTPLIEGRLEAVRSEDARVVKARKRLLELGELPRDAK